MQTVNLPWNLVGRELNRVLQLQVTLDLVHGSSIELKS